MVDLEFFKPGVFVFSVIYLGKHLLGENGGNLKTSVMLLAQGRLDMNTSNSGMREVPDTTWKSSRVSKGALGSSPCLKLCQKPYAGHEYQQRLYNSHISYRLLSTSFVLRNQVICVLQGVKRSEHRPWWIDGSRSFFVRDLEALMRDTAAHCLALQPSTCCGQRSLVEISRCSYEGVSCHLRKFSISCK